MGTVPRVTAIAEASISGPPAAPFGRVAAVSLPSQASSVASSQPAVKLGSSDHAFLKWVEFC